MRRFLTTVLGVCLLSATATANVFTDDFSAANHPGGTLDRTVWNDGGGFFYGAANENLLISSFGTGFGKIGDGTGAAGLNSDVGFASFTVTDNGVNPLGGNFQIAKDNFANADNALVRVNFADSFFNWDPEGINLVEVVWNNTTDPTPRDFETNSGWTGTIAGNSSVVVVNDERTSPQWQTPANRANVNEGDAANRFGFWIVSGVNAVVDDVLIRDTLLPPDGPVGDFDNDGDVDGQDFLEWQESDGTPAGLSDWQGSYPAAPLAGIAAVPEPTVIALVLPGLLGLMGSHRRTR